MPRSTLLSRSSSPKSTDYSLATAAPRLAPICGGTRSTPRCIWSARFVNANFDFYGKILHGVPQLKPRWKRCVGYTDDELGEALGQVFVSRTFTPETKQRAQVMTKEIEVAMKGGNRKPPWDEPSGDEAEGA